MATTDSGYIDVTDKETYETFDEYLAEGQRLAREINEGLDEARELAKQVRDADMTMEEYDDNEVVEDVGEAISEFDQWARGRPEFGD
jgi:uncharacterized protein YbcC (UPF0753/DUF2309 family)